jgi:hypothetical protein
VDGSDNWRGAQKGTGEQRRDGHGPCGNAPRAAAPAVAVLAFVRVSWPALHVRSTSSARAGDRLKSFFFFFFFFFFFAADSNKRSPSSVDYYLLLSVLSGVRGAWFLVCGCKGIFGRELVKKTQYTRRDYECLVIDVLRFGI